MEASHERTTARTMLSTTSTIWACWQLRCRGLAPSLPAALASSCPAALAQRLGCVSALRQGVCVCVCWQGTYDRLNSMLSRATPHLWSTLLLLELQYACDIHSAVRMAHASSLVSCVQERPHEWSACSQQRGKASQSCASPTPDMVKKRLLAGRGPSTRGPAVDNGGERE